MKVSKSTAHSVPLLEFRAELLKERIYATFALLAVLLTIDIAHVTALQVIMILAGTSLSLWAASWVASRMSYRIVMQKTETDHRRLRLLLAQHRPLLYAAVFPIFVHLFALGGFISVRLAIDISLASLVFLLVAWSLLSAKAMHAGRLATIVLAGIELLVGLTIIGLKLWAGH